MTALEAQNTRGNLKQLVMQAQATFTRMWPIVFNSETYEQESMD